MRSDILFQDAQRIISGLDLSPLDGAKVFITGATGLIGTHLMTSLLLMKESGLKIEVTGSNHSPLSPYMKYLVYRSGFDILEDESVWHEDVVIHAAGYAQPSVFTSNPDETLRINATLTQSLLDCLQPKSKFLFVSSSEVYNGLRGIVNESYIGTTTPYHPRACYIEGKRCGEAITNAYRSKGIDAKSARLGLAYGPGTRLGDKRALSVFIEKALTLGRIEMQYAGGELRTYSYIADAVRTLWNVLLHGKEPVYNVGGKSLTTIGRMAKMVGEITGAEVVFPLSDSCMAGAPEAVQMSTDRADTEFGLDRDTIGLRPGLERAVDWYRGLYADNA